MLGQFLHWTIAQFKRSSTRFAVQFLLEMPDVPLKLFPETCVGNLCARRYCVQCCMHFGSFRHAYFRGSGECRTVKNLVMSALFLGLHSASHCICGAGCDGHRAAPGGS